MTEWRSVPSWEGLYEVSDSGQVRSLDRIVFLSSGQRQLRRGRILRIHSNGSKGHLKVWLTRGVGERSHHYVHTLVLEAFVGPRPTGAQGLHWDDDPTNNAVSNLRWGTPGENLLDCVRNGNHFWANKTHCRCGCALIFSGGQRRCPNRTHHDVLEEVR